MLAPVQWNTRILDSFFYLYRHANRMSVPCSNKTLWRCSVTSHHGRTGSPIIFNCFNYLGSLVL